MHHINTNDCFHLKYQHSRFSPEFSVL